MFGSRSKHKFSIQRLQHSNVHYFRMFHEKLLETLRYNQIENSIPRQLGRRKGEIDSTGTKKEREPVL